jgi:ubiquinone/menaquinone biosynthesis C-methylase UbiE
MAARSLDRWRYAVSQGLRVAWYAGHYAVAARSAGQIDVKPADFKYPSPARGLLMQRMRSLFEQDIQNIDDGIYVAPRNSRESLRELIGQSRKFLIDLPTVEERREIQGGRTGLEGLRNRYPDYYLHNFHYQTDGYLSEKSAALYDFQVEALFAGAADAMRRQALIPLAEFMRGRDQRNVNFVDVGSGTGGFLSFVMENYPRLSAVALDLSEPYAAHGDMGLSIWRTANSVVANAEAMPFAEGSQDVVTSVYLFHELPEQVRAFVLEEIRRVLRPGGRLILVDSIQFDDDAELNRLLEYFPHAFHEPYYKTYVEGDLQDLAERNGFCVVSKKIAYLSKILTLEKGA